MTDQCTDLIKQIGVKRYPGSSTKKGKIYHSLPFGSWNTHRRGTSCRADLIKNTFPVMGKTGLDLGCSAGGLSFYLQLAGATMVAIDYDPAVIAFARGIASEYNCPVHFICDKINVGLLAVLKRFDFVIWFDSWMWIEKQLGMKEAKKCLSIISEKTNVLFFSTSQNDGKARNEIKTPADVEQLLKETTTFTTIRNLGTVEDNWHKRSIFFASRG